MKPSLKWVITFVLTVGFGIYWVIQFRSLDRELQSTHKSLCELPTIKLLSRAFYLTGGKGSSSPSGIEFEDEKYKNFRITGSQYLAIDNVSVLFDTLNYSATEIKIYTDDEGCANYFNEKSKEDIQVYALRIGNRDFITHARTAKEDRKLIRQSLIIAPILYSVIVLMIFFSKKSK